MELLGNFTLSREWSPCTHFLLHVLKTCTVKTNQTQLTKRQVFIDGIGRRLDLMFSAYILCRYIVVN